MAGILIVEDERVAAWNIQSALEKFGYTVVANIGSGDKAVGLAGTLKPDLVLMDIRLPGEIDGIEAAARIRNQFKIPVVYLTAYTDDQTIERAIATDPYGYLTKPFKRAELHTTITTALHRCQLEKQLQATQQWLTSTLNSIGDGTITTDQEGRITFMNPVAEALTGWLLTEAMGKPVNQVLELYNAQTGQAIENPVLLAMQEGIPFELPKQCQLRTKQGKERLIDDVATPIRDAFGQVQGGVIVFRDTTETQRMQAALQESEARFQRLAANLPGIIYKVLHRLDGSVECLYLSRYFQILFEMALESFQQGKDFILAAIHPDDASSLHTAIETMLQTLQPHTWEGRIQVPSGQIKWIQIINRSSRQANGDIICDGLIVDISERKRTEQALQRQMQRERLLSEVAQQIHKSFDLHEILTTVVTKVRQMLEVDRVLIFQINPDGSGVVIQESVRSVSPTLGLSFCDKCFPSDCYEFYWHGQSRVIPDTSEDEWSNCLTELMQKLGVKSKVVIPIIQHQGTATTSLKSPARKLWGLLIVHACDDYRQWESEEVDLLRQISNHLAIAIQQSELYQKLQQANEHLECLVKIDALTQVANRRRFDEYIQQQWNQLAREQKPLSLILCDIDFFKRYNDTYGHPAGDACLVQIAEAINHSVKRPADLVTRYGGEEFAVILPNTDHKGAVHVAITIQNQVRQLQLDHIGSNVADYVTVSMGIVTTVPSDNSSPQALIAATDRSLYQAKQQGRDRYCIKTL
ncbi:diguanylate cyclase domain-containing protein [Scytonema sp. PRP1]|uniref:diguanylate cyclase domain-containing protein n=1 Tax=Scytonema sp. PRP1 TaxID=3120513 RepID=UPI002FD03092